MPSLSLSPTGRERLQGAYSREALAATLGVTPRLISKWVNRKLLSPAHGRNPRWKYYSDDHLRQGRAILALKDLNTCFSELGGYLAEEGITTVEYLAQRRAALAAIGPNGLGEPSHA